MILNSSLLLSINHFPFHLLQQFSNILIFIANKQSFKNKNMLLMSISLGYIVELCNRSPFFSLSLMILIECNRLHNGNGNHWIETFSKDIFLPLMYAALNMLVGFRKRIIHYTTYFFMCRKFLLPMCICKECTLLLYNRVYQKKREILLRK